MKTTAFVIVFLWGVAGFGIGYWLGRTGACVPYGPTVCGRCGAHMIYRGAYFREFSCGNAWETEWTGECDRSATTQSASASEDAGILPGNSGVATWGTKNWSRLESVPATTYFHPKQATAETMEGGKPGTIY